jgi:integrase
MKTLICTYQVSEARKELLADAYDYYVQFKGLAWNKPKFTREDKPIFLPTETELETLIGRARFKMSVFLQLLKETGADSGEAWKLRWIDIDTQNNKVSITPTKNHNARTVTVSSNLISRLVRLPRKNDRVFSTKNLDGMRTQYERMRNKLSIELSNPRLHEIALRSFRHFRATQLYYRTKDILFVKWFLGHKRLENTLVYTHMVNFASEEYVCKVANNVEEAKALIEAGYEYVTEVEGLRLFRKMK